MTITYIPYFAIAWAEQEHGHMGENSGLGLGGHRVSTFRGHQPGKEEAEAGFEEGR
jgi:hypothetical protein